VVGQNLAFTTLVEGSLPLSFQWFKDGTALAGKTQQDLTVGTANFGDVGSYQVMAYNPAWTKLSSTAVVRVSPVPKYVNATKRLALHLRFDGNLQDSSGRNNNGTAEGSPGFLTGMIGSGALHYSTGASGPTVTNANYVSLGTPADLQFGASDFSVAF